MKSCFLITVLIGVASGLTFKNQLLAKLDVHSQNLIAKMDYCASHSQLFVRGIYEQTLNFTHEMRSTIEALKPEVQPNDWGFQRDYMYLYNALVQYVTDRLLDANPEETSKTSAIYVAAMKEVTHFRGYHMPENYLKAVQLIIDTETDLATKPTVIVPDFSRPNEGVKTWVQKSNLVWAYRELRQTFNSWWVPSFEDHYELANRTREAVVIYKQNGKIQEAARIENILAEFDRLTILLAREWPIVSKQKMDFYYNTSQEHYKLFLELQHLEPYQYPIREILIEDLNTQEILVNKTITIVTEGAYWYYKDVLRVTFDQIRRLTHKVLALPVDATPEQASQITAEVAAQQKLTESTVKDPAPEELLKAKALYLSVTQKAENQTGSAWSLLEQVKKIAHKQVTLTTPEMPLEEKLQKYAGSAELQKYYEELRGMVSGHVLWSQGQDSQLKKAATDMIFELEKKGQRTAASRIDVAKRNFIPKSRAMNWGMPILFNYQPPVLGYYENCQSHFEKAQKLKALIAQWS